MAGTLSVSAGRPAVSPRGAQLYVALESGRPWAGSSRHALEGVDRVLIGRGDRRARREDDPVGPLLRIEVPDAGMSTSHARLLRIGGRWLVEDAGSRNGTRVDGVAAARTELEDGAIIEAGETLLVFRTSQARGTLPLDEQAPRQAPPGMATLVPPLAAAFAELGRVAASTVPILLLGETGTGKELAARGVHALSGRKGELVPVNCAALPATLVESELFGHRRGAFSGAVEDRPGLVRSARDGTLLLDEVGDLPPAAQAVLLRVLQEHEVRPVGGERAVPVDVRFVGATHRDLRERVAEGTFRHDLLARLAGFEMHLPPLRERREEMGLLVAAILDRIRPGPGLTFSLDASRALLGHSWPGNVRELEQALRAAVVRSDGRVERDHLPPWVGSTETEPEEGDPPLRARVERLLRTHDGNVAAVARELGKDPRQVRRWMARLGIERP